jgi:hypothetical protein
MKKVFPFILLLVSTAVSAQGPQPVGWEQYIRKSAVPAGVIASFLHGPAWAQFDPQTGYVLRNSLVPWGEKGTVTIETTQSDGARTTLLYAAKPVRINAYGDSFTESAQVSDGETWEEYLAGSLGEPVRNFGVGGYGMWQAYLRMIREEKTAHAAPYIIFTICCDDPTRSLLRSRHAVIYPWWDDEGGRMFHANFWSNLELNLNSGKWEEKEQLLRTPASLQLMSDPNWTADHLRSDIALQLYSYSAGANSELNHESVTKLARLLDFPFDWAQSTNESPAKDETAQPTSPMRSQVEALLNRYGQRAAIYVIQKTLDFAAKNHKHVLFVLNATTPFTDGHKRNDQEIIDYSKQNHVPYADMNELFHQRYNALKSGVSFAEFMKGYMVNGAGHMNPAGNLFVANAIREPLAQMLDPKPIPYQLQTAKTVNWDGYLHGGIYPAQNDAPK